jgi:hypothetical protein
LPKYFFVLDKFILICYYLTERRCAVKFYVIEGGRLVERVWCDNPACPHYSGRVGIPDQDVVPEELLPEDQKGKDFCPMVCAKQAPEAEAHEARLAGVS